MRAARAIVGGALLGAGVLLYAASWQRWADACPWPVGTTAECGLRQDSRYEFLSPTEGWEPVGSAAQLAGVSTTALALVLALLPLAMTGHVRPRNPGWPWLVLSVVSAVLVGVATLRAGLAGAVVEPPGAVLTVTVWLLLAPYVVGWLAVLALGCGHGGGRAPRPRPPAPGTGALRHRRMGLPPWWEAISGILMGVAGVCLLVAALRRTPTALTEQSSAEVAVRATT